jgi:hypothetical protein
MQKANIKEKLKRIQKKIKAILQFLYDLFPPMSDDYGPF